MRRRVEKEQKPPQEVLKAYYAAYGDLQDGLLDMINEERLSEGDIPEDFMWLKRQLTGPCRKADRLVKQLLTEGGESHLVGEMREALAIAEGIIDWALTNGADKTAVGAIRKYIKKVLAKAKRSRTLQLHIPGSDNGIYKYLDVSTDHITEQDMRLLDYKGRPRLEHGIISVPNEYGAWVHCLSDQGFTENNYEKVRAGGFSDSFIKLLEFARTRGCEWINIDQDGHIHGEDELDRNEW